MRYNTEAKSPATSKCFERIVGYEKYLETAVAQAVFLRKYPGRFFNAVEDRFLPKIIADIGYILGEGWAGEISGDDFFHLHICGNPLTCISRTGENVEEDMNRLLAPDRLRFLYHTLEYVPVSEPGFMNRNVLSDSRNRPYVIRPTNFELEKTGWNSYTVNACDLHMLYYAQIDFWESGCGEYMLADGTKIDLSGDLGITNSLLFFRKEG